MEAELTARELALLHFCVELRLNELRRRMIRLEWESDTTPVRMEIQELETMLPKLKD